MWSEVTKVINIVRKLLIVNFKNRTFCYSLKCVGLKSINDYNLMNDLLAGEDD